MSRFGVVGRWSSVAVLAFASLPLAARADDASKRVKVEQMITLTKVDTVAQQMLSNVPPRIKQVASQQLYVRNATTPEQKKITDDYLQQMNDIAVKGTAWLAVHEKVVAIYMEAFTEADLDGILAFYKTPAGQALVNKMPTVSGKTIETLQGTVNTMEPDLKAATLAYQTKMKNASPASTPEKAPSLGPETPAPTTTPTLKPR